MATELGKAYVQIMPSAKGISGSIQKAIGPEALSAGKSAGKNIMTAISDSLSKAGSTLTKYITTPALGAATAVAGVVSALGFKRLTGMDNAQAKLKGLGIEGKQLEIVLENARNAVQGTTHTMADAANVAAGALAAGVKEGADLERYIKLVGDAATGSNAPMGEMAQIFNRVQGTGKLMGTELNMIEHRMPGFSQALAKHLGVAPEKLQEMVSSGKVSSKDFLDTMENFAGGMSEAYAGTWSGLKDNVLANIGIIGEALLEGLFEDGKQGMAEFLDFLRNSKGLEQWAQETGEKLRLAFQKIVEVIKDTINWWSGLSDGAKKFIGVASGIMVAMGPILGVVAKIITTIMKLTPLFKILGTVIGAITSPIGLVVAAIIGAVALIYIYWEPIKEFFLNLWESIKEAGLLIWENLKEGWQNAKENLTEAWESVKEFFSNLWESVKEIFTTVWSAIVTVVTTVINVIKAIIMTVFNVIKAYFTTVLNGYRVLFTTVWTAIRVVITTVSNIIRGIITTAWNGIRTVISSVLNAIRSVVSSVWNGIRSVITSVMNGIRSVITSIWNGIRSVITSVLNGIRSVVSSIFNGLRGIVSGAMNGVRSAVSSGMRGALSVVTGMISNFFNAGKNIVGAIADGIKGAIGKVTGAISSVASKIRDFLPFSPPKTGPLLDIMVVKWGKTIGGGILKGEDEVANAMDEILNFDLTKKATFVGIGKDEMINNYALIKQNQPIILQVDGKTFAQSMGDYTSAEGGKHNRKIERVLA